MDSSPKNSGNIYSPLCHSNPVWFSLYNIKCDIYFLLKNILATPFNAMKVNETVDML